MDAGSGLPATGAHDAMADAENGTLKKKISMHKAFWARSPMERPLIVFHLAPDFFFSTHYAAARRLLANGKKIIPALIDVDAFLDDYERMYRAVSGIEQDGFWAAQPYTGIPWMEGILGCEIRATENSFISQPQGRGPADLDGLAFDPDNPWFRKYLEFTVALQKLSNGRFPVGEPIMRGPSDMAGALMGQSEMVFALIDAPERMHRLFSTVTDILLEVMAAQFQLLEPFHGGYSLGFYPVWSPGKCIWFQEDLSALLSPAHYRRFLKAPAERICRAYDYTAVHLHPASFFIVDALLEIDRLRVVEVNKDVGGPSVAEMVPVLKKILLQKNLILWGDLDEGDIDVITGELPPTGLFLNPMVPTVKRAEQLRRYLESKAAHP